jgi:hypothetical protein
MVAGGEVEVVTIPQVGLYDPPAADEAQSIGAVTVRPRPTAWAAASDCRWRLRR